MRHEPTALLPANASDGFATDRLWLQRLPSWRLALIVIALHAVAIVSIWHVDMPLPLRLALMLALGVHGVYMLGEQVLFGLPCAVTRLRREAGRWEVTYADGSAQAATWARPPWVPGPVALLSFITARGRCEVLLLPDGVRYDEFRRLRAQANLGYLYVADESVADETSP